MEQKEEIKEPMLQYNTALGFLIEAGLGVKFTFNNINMKNPHEEYSLTVGLENDTYTLLACDPHLDDTKMLILELKKTSDLCKFVRTMKQKFQEAASLGCLPQSTTPCQESSTISLFAPVRSVSTERSESPVERNDYSHEEVKRHTKKVKHTLPSPPSVRRSPRFVTLCQESSTISLSAPVRSVSTERSEYPVKRNDFSHEEVKRHTKKVKHTLPSPPSVRRSPRFVTLCQESSTISLSAPVRSVSTERSEYPVKRNDYSHEVKRHTKKVKHTLPSPSVRRSPRFVTLCQESSTISLSAPVRSVSTERSESPVKRDDYSHEEVKRHTKKVNLRSGARHTLPSLPSVQLSPRFVRPRFYESASARKRTVTAEERERAMNAAKAFEPPENPYCRVVLRPSYLYRGCIMYLPSSFVEKNLKGVRRFIKLQLPDGKQWPVRCLYRGGIAKFSEGWYEFTLENGLGEGDVCVFELLKSRDVVLKVTVFCVVDSAGLMNQP